MAKQVVWTTPELKHRKHWNGRDGEELTGRNACDYWLCIPGLEQLIEFPRAQRYWLQISRTQWTDESGTCVELERRGCENHVYYRIPDGTDFSGMHTELEIWLENKLRIGSGDYREFVYFRLLYKE